MASSSNDNWQAITGLVSELKRCDEHGMTTASVAMAFICIDTLASLGRPIAKKKVTRSDFKEWVDIYLEGHQDQPYKYRGKDVYAARCAFLHTYGSEAELHEDDLETIRFAYHDGGRHEYDASVEHGLVIISTKSFVDDVVHAVKSFLTTCQSDSSLRQRVEERLPGVLQTMPFPSR